MSPLHEAVAATLLAQRANAAQRDGEAMPEVAAGYLVALNDAAYALAETLAQADRARFLTACGVTA